MMNRRVCHGLVVVLLAFAPTACFKPSDRGPLPPTTVTAETHPWFPLTAGTAHELGRELVDGKMACESCHAPASASFKDFSCTGCHGHEKTVTDLLHLARPAEYAYESGKCYSCHANGNGVGFSHFGITNDCAKCHQPGAQFAALPLPGFTHPETNGADCARCHDTSTWKGAPRDSHDPARDIAVDVLIPTYAGTSISSLSPQTEVLPQFMNHQTTAVDASVMAACSNCHDEAAANVFFPGMFHASLDFLKVPQPTACIDCHAQTMPTGFVGPIDAARSPASGAMKHDAVAWSNDAPTTTPAATSECATCHTSPAHRPATWWMRTDGQSPAVFHAALTAAGQAQPSSCVDCHAGSRPTEVLTSASAPGLPAGMEYDHQSPAALGDCAGCHNNKAAVEGTSWAGARFHPPGSASPKTCLPCHAGERPTSTAGWASATYTKSPFDYGTNARGVTHGAGQDCATCHTGPGTGAWGANQNWQGGVFAHGPGSVAATTCIACHSTQVPAQVVMSFDHAKNGKADCFGCHQATVMAGKYVNYFNPGTGTLPGGDWQGGQTYPGAVLSSSGDTSVTVTEIKLVRAGSGLVTGTTSSQHTLMNGIVHTSTAIDSRLSPGTTGSPDNTKCWHCHTNSNGTVTEYAGGVFHAALTNYRATPGGAVSAIAQPTSRCGDCHAQMRPSDIVEKAASTLQPMNHAAEFTAAVTIAGVSVTSVSQLDCATCHKSPPTSAWSDGRFHASIGSAVPKDCVACHYPLMADAAKADVTTGTRFLMKHRSGQITFQTCQTCHAMALSKATSTTITAMSWSPGAFHPSVSAQPKTCTECHSVSLPPANKPTQGTETYTLAMGATASNEGQWMNHGSSYVAGKDCAACHAADAKASGSAWSKATPFHTNAASVTTCNGCHGLGNGGGSVVGTSNNLPIGLTNSTTVTSAAKTASTGVAAGTLDQINHADVNVTGKDCSFCHTQVGPSTAAGVAGKEWAQAKFHSKFNTTNPLVMNGTTGRCSTCHMNVKPGASYAGYNHASLTSASGTTDCSSCHSWPGAGGSGSPDWKGATGGVPQVISVGGFTIPKPPAANTTTVQAGISNLPHPTVGSQACTVCHSDGGGRKAIGYDHAPTSINNLCGACHEAGSDLVSPVWNGATTQVGAGDTRPFTLKSVQASADGNNCTVSYPNHFYPADCSQCHVKPTGTVTGKTGAAFSNAWRFNHNEGKMKGTCNMCHGPCPGD